jgi:hypothetical protein
MSENDSSLSPQDNELVEQSLLLHYRRFLDKYSRLDNEVQKLKASIGAVTRRMMRLGANPEDIKNAVTEALEEALNGNN